jgi:hypothetical protein
MDCANYLILPLKFYIDNLVLEAFLITPPSIDGLMGGLA